MAALAWVTANRDELGISHVVVSGESGGGSRTVNGTCHAGDVLFRAAMPDVYAASVRDLRGFVDAVG